MLSQPGAGLGTGVATQVVGDDKSITGWIGCREVSEQSNRAFGVA